MLTRAQKEDQVSELRDKFARASSVFVADYRGLSVKQVTDLRARLSGGEGDVDYRVAKNTLLRRAVDGSGAEVLLEHFSGPTAVALSYGDPVQLAKALVDYSKENEVFELKGGYLDGKALGTAEIATLATLPSLDQLRAKLVGLVQAPATKLVRLLKEPGGQLARLVAAQRDKLEESGGA